VQSRVWSLRIAHLTHVLLLPSKRVSFTRATVKTEVNYREKLQLMARQVLSQQELILRTKVSVVKKEPNDEQARPASERHTH
jgi:hypothetical protein